MKSAVVVGGLWTKVKPSGSDEGTYSLWLRECRENADAPLTGRSSPLEGPRDQFDGGVPLLVSPSMPSFFLAGDSTLLGSWSSEPLGLRLNLRNFAVSIKASDHPLKELKEQATYHK